jgi:hypothetical protein
MLPMPYALFDHDERISDLPVADEEGGQVVPSGFHIRRIDELFDPRPDWKLPREIT